MEQSSSPAGAGRTYVDLVSCLERATHAAAHAYPAVDHVLPHPPPPSDAALDVLGAHLAVWGSAALEEAFEHWRSMHGAFVIAIGRLEELRGHEGGNGEFEGELTRRIHAVRAARLDLGHAADELRDRLAAFLDDLATHAVR